MSSQLLEEGGCLLIPTFIFVAFPVRMNDACRKGFTEIEPRN
jgi:hypothetical protein